jgi:hypothetical protein
VRRAQALRAARKSDPTSEATKRLAKALKQDLPPLETPREHEEEPEGKAEEEPKKELKEEPEEE